MDPILSSTVDFDRYIQERISSSRETQQKAGRGSNKKTLNEIDSTDSTYHFKLNVSKFGTKKVTNSSRTVGIDPSADKSRPKEKKNSGNDDRVSEGSPLLMEFSHSWRGHMARPGSSLSANHIKKSIHIPSIDSFSKDVSLLNIESPKDWSEIAEKILSPKRPNYQKETSSNFQDIIIDFDNPHPKSPLRNVPISPPRLNSIPLIMPPKVVPNRYDTFIHEQNMSENVKVRSFQLNRILKCWKKYVKASQIYLQRREQELRSMRWENLQCFCFDSWRNLSLATKFNISYLNYRARLYLRRWHLMASSGGKSNAFTLIDRFYKERLKRQAVGQFYQLLIIRRRRTEKKLRLLKALKFRSYMLLWRTWGIWKETYGVTRHTKAISEERRGTQDRINSFLKRFEDKKDGKLLSSQSKSMVSTGRSSSNLRVNSRKIDSNCNSNSNSNREERTKMNASSATGSAASASASVGAPKTSTSSYRNTSLGTAKKTSGPNIQSSRNESKDQSDEVELSPPPSYRHFAKETSHNSPGEEKEGFSTEKDGAETREEQISKASNLSKAGLSKRTQQLSDFEARAKERKDKLASLRQQAVERVRQRQLEGEERIKQKKQQEAEEFAKFVNDERQKKEEMKLKSMPNRGLIEEMKRKCQIADEFRRKNLLIRRGFAPWMRYLVVCESNISQANTFCAEHLLRRTWERFLGYCVSLKTERVRREYRQSMVAATHFKRKLLRAHWTRWKLYRKLLKAKAKAVTGQFSRYTLPKRVFSAWKLAYERSLRETARNLRAVQSKGDRSFMRYYWRLWLDYLKDRLVDREVNYRAEQKWMAVQSWLKK